MYSTSRVNIFLPSYGDTPGLLPFMYSRLGRTCALCPAVNGWHRSCVGGDLKAKNFYSNPFIFDLDWISMFYDPNFLPNLSSHLRLEL